MMTLHDIQEFLRGQDIDGWLLYDFRGTNPVALHIAGLASSGSRRWFLWLPAQGEPAWLIHAIEGNTFARRRLDLAGALTQYVGWRDLEEQLGRLVQTGQGPARRIAMEYSPNNAIPYVSRVDAGTKEMVERVTGAEIVSSADLVQMAQAVLADEQITSHRRAAAILLAAKDAGFDFIRSRLQSNVPTTEYEVQQFLVEQFKRAGLDYEHDPIVAANAHAADPHFAPTAEHHSPIRAGDMVLFDLWGRETRTPHDCFADITWVAYCGAETPAPVRELFSIVAAGRDAAVDFIQKRLDAGSPVHGYEADDACRAVISAAGYGANFIHRTGHSIGTATHFNGVNIDNLETQDRRTLIPGVMFTVEPGIYLPDFDFDGSGVAKGVGLRSEINCLMHAHRIEVTTLPRQTEVVTLG